MGVQDQDPDVQRASKAFIAELRSRREELGWSKRQLAEQMPVDPSYVSHIEAGRHRPTEDFARRADEVLNAGGALKRRWEAYRLARAQTQPPTGRDLRAASRMLFETALWVESDEAEQRFDGEAYTMTMRRRLYNVGHEPIIRYFMRVNIDRSDNSPHSTEWNRPGPLTWKELGLSAHCESQEMAFEPVTDQDELKEVWLLFENSNCRFPLYPGERTLIEYSYTVPAEKWGRWFQRAVRLPTGYLSAKLVFPHRHTPHRVWGTEASMTVARRELRTPVESYRTPDASVYRWGTANPPLSTRYRLEWSPIGHDGRPEPVDT